MKLLNTEQAAEMKGVSVRRIQQLIEAGTLEATKVGRDWVMSEEAVKGVSVYGKAGRPVGSKGKKKGVKARKGASGVSSGGVSGKKGTSGVRRGGVSGEAGTRQVGKEGVSGGLIKTDARTALALTELSKRSKMHTSDRLTREVLKPKPALGGGRVTDLDAVGPPVSGGRGKASIETVRPLAMERRNKKPLDKPGKGKGKR